MSGTMLGAMIVIPWWAILAGAAVIVALAIILIARNKRDRSA